MNYAQIQDLITKTIKDDDLVDDPTIVQGFIADFESVLSGDLIDESYGQEVPRNMLKRIIDTTDITGKLVLPSDYMRARAVRFNNNIAKYIAPEKVQINAETTAESPIQLDYYALVPTLASSDSNWVSTQFHTVYKWGASLQYIGWSHRYDNLQAWTGFYTAAVKSLKKATGVRPSGGLFRQKERPYSFFYTVIGNDMYFTNSNRSFFQEPFS